MSNYNYNFHNIFKISTATRLQRLTKERLRMFLEMEEPQKDFKLPALNTAPQNRVGGTGITFSLSEGLQWKVRELSIYTRLFHRLIAHPLKKRRQSLV